MHINIKTVNLVNFVNTSVICKKCYWKKYYVTLVEGVGNKMFHFSKCDKKIEFESCFMLKKKTCFNKFIGLAKSGPRASFDLLSFEPSASQILCVFQQKLHEFFLSKTVIHWIACFCYQTWNLLQYLCICH